MAQSLTLLKVLLSSWSFKEDNKPECVPVNVPEFEEWLHPLNFDAVLRRHNDDFVEGTRQWIFDDLEAWRKDATGSRSKVLLAGPGFGKTAIAARLHKSMNDRVLVIHLCRHKDSLKHDPRRMIASIASRSPKRYLHSEMNYAKRERRRVGHGLAL